jgi:hypothetical protein
MRNGVLRMFWRCQGIAAHSCTELLGCGIVQVAKKRRKREPPEEIHVAWKGGLAQQRAAMEAAQRAAAEAAKAFGR